MSHIPTEKPSRVYKILLMTLPVGVVVGTIVFMFMYFYNERRDERQHPVIASHKLRIGDLEDMVDKFSQLIGVRNIETEQGRQGLLSAASMIEGRLGPQNVGYPVRKSEGVAVHGRLWKSLSVEIRGNKTPDEVVIVAASYASMGESADAYSISTLIMLASSMAREKPARTLRFVFLPMDKSPSEQNRWITERCLLAGESCAGIIGLMSMEKSLRTGTSVGDWQVLTSSEADKQWWEFLAEDGSGVGNLADSFPSIWVTHSVFSPSAWDGKKEDRLARTVKAAQEIRAWLLKAAG